MYWCGDHWCQQRWKQQYILDKITMKILLLSRTPTSLRSWRWLTSRRSWSWIRSTRFWMFPRLSGTLLLLWDLLCYMKKQLSGRKQRYTCTQTQFFVWERCRSVQKPGKNGKISFNTSKSAVDKQNYLEYMKNHLSSSAIFYYDMQHCSFFNDIGWTKKGNSTECSTSDKVKNYARRFQLGHWAFFGWGEEEKWYETHNLQTWRTMECYCHERQFQRQRTSSIPSFQCVGSGILSKEMWAMYDSLQCGTFECRAFISLKWVCQSFQGSSELVWQINSAVTWSHSSVEKSVGVNDQLSQKLEPQEVDSLVQTPRTNVQAAGDRLRAHHQRFEELFNGIQIT